MIIDKVNRIYLLYLVLLGFFGLNILNYATLDFVYFAIVLYMAYPAIQSKGTYPQMIRWYVVFVLISCIYSWVVNGQSLFQVTVRSYEYFALMSFFILLQADLSSKEVIKVLEMLALTFCIGYIVQWLVYPTTIFSMVDFFANEETGKYRARMVGSILCYFFLIYSINRLLLRSGWKYMLYGVLGFIPIIIQGFRSMILLTLFAVFAMIPIVLRSGWKTIAYSIIGLGIALLAVNNSLVQSKIEEMSRRQERNQSFDNEDYIRWLSLDYYWNQQFTKPLEKFLGGGRPVDKGSNYAKRIVVVKKYYHFYWTDLGLVGFSMIVGMPAVFLLILMYVRCMWRCKDPSIQFVRFTLFIVLVGSLFVNSELYRRGNLLLLSLFLYLEYKYNQETRHSDLRKKYYTIKQIFEAIKKETNK